MQIVFVLRVARGANTGIYRVLERKEPYGPGSRAYLQRGKAPYQVDKVWYKDGTHYAFAVTSGQEIRRLTLSAGTGWKRIGLSEKSLSAAILDC